MGRAQRRAGQRQLKKRITLIKATTDEPVPHVAPSNALVQEGIGYVVFMEGAPAWPYPSHDRDGAERILARLRREMGKGGYDPRAETLEIRPVQMGDSPA